MSVAQIPIQSEPVVDDTKKVTLPWQAFFEGVATGDVGNSWTPTFQNLTSTGPAPTLRGVYYFLSNKLVYFRIDIVPGSGGDTSGVAGTTYCDNFPLTIGADSGAFTLGGSGAGVAAVNASSKRIFTGTWTTATGVIYLTGIIEIL